MSSGVELPTLQEIISNASKSSLLNDPHVRTVWELSGDRGLFDKSPEYLAKLRKDLLRSSLKYFDKCSEFYHELFKRIDVDISAAEVEDLIKLAVPSDLLRGDGYKKFLIEGLKEPGFIFSSSGTTSSTPVRVYRSYLELAMMTKANTLLFEYVYGGELKEGRGVALFLAAKELRSVLNFVAFVDLALQYKKIKLIYGMDLVESEGSSSQWKKLVPNQKRIMDFLKSKEEPKLFFTAPAGVHLLTKKFDEMNPLKRIFAKAAYGIPPVNLGDGGVIVTGGGSKGFDIPPYGEIVEHARKYFKVRVDNEVKPAPFMDVYGMTETLTALIDRFGTMNKIPHPLQEVLIVDLKTLKPIDEPGKEGIAIFFDPLAVSWLEVFIPGDVLMFQPSDRYYGKEFIYVRRLSKEEGWDLQRACGGALEEMMTRGIRSDAPIH
ncbi:MAG: hypothetical protein RMH77_00695 [Sulfolobales archaeon]|nr:long-chain fatty acid--CoA ligase [Sulfolobales archaeon]MCX8186349.1 long-chain fatty acid--CoA ligase [Sulfolobales archaeon]MDW7968915.1 hypothetical protein [Sulfolobales archaeon]